MPRALQTQENNQKHHRRNQKSSSPTPRPLHRRVPNLRRTLSRRQGHMFRVNKHIGTCVRTVPAQFCIVLSNRWKCRHRSRDRGPREDALQKHGEAVAFLPSVQFGHERHIVQGTESPMYTVYDRVSRYTEPYVCPDKTNGAL